MANERKHIRMTNKRTGRPIPDPDTIEDIVNTIEDPIDNSPPAGIKSGFSVFNPAPFGAKPKEITMAREAGVQVVQVIGYKDGDYTPVPNAGRLYAWNWQNLKKLLS